MSDWYRDWSKAITASPPGFEDSAANVDSENRKFILGRLTKSVDALTHLALREEEATIRRQRLPQVIDITSGDQSLISSLQMTYDGPGELREGEARHDNDFASIEDIHIVPTNKELCSDELPFLPGNFYGAPHHLSASSPERLLDIQFRLLREEFM